MTMGEVQITSSSVCGVEGVCVCVCVCVCVVDVFFCMVRTEWTKLPDCISPIHETSDDRYVVMVFVGRFDFYFIILLLLIGE